MKYKICTKCHNEFPATTDYFNRSNRNKDGYYSWCKKCHSNWSHKKYIEKCKNPEFLKLLRKRHKQQYYKDIDKSRKQHSIYAKKYNQKLKKICIDHYGGKCNCPGCNESRIEFLTIDHINGGGNEHRRNIGFGSIIYSWLIKNNFPKGFQVLCHNCNFAKSAYGHCPHQEENK